MWQAKFELCRRAKEMLASAVISGEAGLTRNATMSKSTEKSADMLLFRGMAWDRELSSEQLQKVVTDWYAWFERLVREGKIHGDHPLLNAVKLISGKQGRVIADGPFAESKEAIGGYFYLEVANEDEAVRISRECPGLEHGCVVELRPVGERCADRVRGFEPTARAGNLVGARPQIREPA